MHVQKSTQNANLTVRWDSKKLLTWKNLDLMMSKIIQDGHTSCLAKNYNNVNRQAIHSKSDYNCCKKVVTGVKMSEKTDNLIYERIKSGCFQVPKIDK